MAGTCKYCWASTWGRYRICPNCRKERKRKGRRNRNYSSSRHSSSREKYVCNSCDYNWRSKKSFGSPAVCPKCKGDNIIPYVETKEYKYKMLGASIAFVVFIAIFFLIFLFSYFSNSLDKTQSSKNLINEIGEEIISPEEELTNFCMSKFSNEGIYNMGESSLFENYDSASQWLDEKYPNEGSTLNRAKFNREWYLDKAEFPIIVVKGDKKIDSSVIEHGTYYCDKNGLIER